MEDSYNHILWIWIWIAVIWLIVWSRWRKGVMGAGLPFAVLVNLWFIHWPAALIYVLPWYVYYVDMERERLVWLGFQQGTYAVIAFGIGSVILAPFLSSAFRRTRPKIISHPGDHRLPTMCLVLGLVSFLALRSPLGRLPTVNSLIAAGANLLVVGLGMKCWEAWQTKRYRLLIRWLIVTLSFPFFTVAFLGFAGMGAMVVLIVFTFISSFVRPRWKLIGVLIIFAYLGISFYGTYSRDRDLIRQVVWSEEATLTDKMDQLYLTLSTPELFSPYNLLHLFFVDRRLNMNSQVGQAVDYLASGAREYAYGQTLWWSVVGMIPRAVWPGKPVIAGGSDLVTYYTGQEFGEGTSVGLGLVTEFYINFGSVGVVLGFLCLGIIVAVVDSAAGRRLFKGDWQGFIGWFLPGLALLNVGGSLVEVTTSAGAAFLMVMGVNKYIRRRLRDKEVLPAGVVLGQEKQPDNTGIVLSKS